MSSSRVATLLAWCAENRIQIDSALHVVDSQHPQPAVSPRRHQANHSGITSDDGSREHALSVYSREELIECHRTLVYIPKTAVLSAKSCFFSQRISSVPYGHGAHLALALALYGELLLGPQSRWFGYLQSLPRETVDIAVFWGINDAIETQTCTCPARGCLSANDTSSAVDKQQQTTPSNCPWCIWLQDNRHAREWLKVTEIDGEQQGSVEEIRQYYHNVAEPTFLAASTNPGLPYLPSSHSKRDRPKGSTSDTNPSVFGVTFPGFCHAYSLVSTRAFWVDAFHGLAMVPIADAFNHTNDNHVQMESDYDVCVECGSLAECEHDREMASTTVPASLVSNVHPLSHDGPLTSSDIDCLEMRTVRPIPPFSEVFNTYGSLSNAVLLSRYGFMLPENEHDTVRMVLDPLSMMRNLIKCVRLEHLPVGEDGHAVTGASGFKIRNTCREQQPYGQGIVGNEATSSLSALDDAWEIAILNRMHHVFTYVVGAWRSDAAWDEQDDEMIFNPQSSLMGHVSMHARDGSARSAQDLVINADGKISHTLWLFCIVVALFAARPQFEASFGDLIERAEDGPEGIASLTELKARLINVQRYVGRLHDGDSDDGDVEGGGNHGSPFPPFPHPALASLELDYDTEPEDFAQPASPVQVQARLAIAPRGMSTSITADLDSDNPLRSPFEPKLVVGRTLCGGGPRNPEISTRFSSIPHALSESHFLSCHPTLAATEQSYPDTPWFSMGRTTGYTAQQRDRSPSAEGERPPKRVRSGSDSVVANRVDRLGRITPESTRRPGDLLGASDEDNTQTTDDATRLLARLLARAVVGLCYDRYRPPTLQGEQRGVGMTAAELGDVLDETPECMHRTRSALVMAISERSVVESCAACWSATLEAMME